MRLSARGLPIPPEWEHESECEYPQTPHCPNSCGRPSGECGGCAYDLCGTVVYDDGSCIEGKQCLQNQLAQKDARIAELESDSNTDLLNLVQILETRSGIDMHDKLLIALNEGHSTPAKCAAEVIWDAWMVALAKLGEYNIKIAELESDAHKLGVVEEFVEAVERRAEDKMLITGKLEGAHYAAMKELRNEYRERAKKPA